jgi:hypothetical protein
MLPRCRPIVGMLVALVGAAAGAAQEPRLDEVLARTGAYVRNLHTQLSGIVAEEHYVQQARDTRRRTTGVPTEQRRQLRSDLLLVRPPDEERYIEFRDVFEVNGTPIRDREERLTKLFLTPTRDSVDRIRAIVNESARHNLGDVMRNVNTPMLALHFLVPSAQPRFAFRRERSGRPQLGDPTDFPGRNAAPFRPPPAAWVISFRETARPTLIKTERDQDFPVSGRFWIDPTSGAVTVSELVLEDSDLSVVINVAHREEASLGFPVPVEMRERYRTSAQHVEGVAEYGRFRRFQVRTGEAVKPPGGLQ